MSLTHGSKPSNTEPRVRTTPTKAERRLAKRQEAFDNNKDRAQSKTEMHRPGSKNRRNKG